MGTAIDQSGKAIGVIAEDGLPVPNSLELLTIEDAASLSGHSRPFIMALLDSPLYKGAVTRGGDGHRRVIRGEFMAWLGAASQPKDLPKTVEDVRSGPRDAEPAALEESEEQRKLRAAAKARAMANARSLGLL